MYPYGDTRRVDVGFVFGVVAPEAAALAQPTSSAQSQVSQIGQTHDLVEQMSAKYASLEHNLFLLDGSFDLYPDDVSGVQTGWQSNNMSGADKVFSAPPWLEFSFSQNQDSFGFTLLFDDKLRTDYPAEAITTAYDAGGAVLGTITTYPTSWNHVVDMPIQGYRKVRFEFLRTKLPYRRVRVCEVRFGIKYEYGKNNVTSVSIKQSVNPWAESLPSAEVDATIDNSSHLYNMINPDGLYAYLQDGQYMEHYIDIDGDRVDMGRRYFTAANSDDGGLTANITFNDWLYILDDVEYNNGVTGTWTLSAAIAALLSGTGMTAVFDGTLGNTTIRKCIPQKTKVREAIRLCAQAAMCTCYVDRDDKLHFVRPTITAKSDTWTRDVQHDDAQVKVGQLYNVVQLTRQDEYADTEDIYTAKSVAVDDLERVYEVDNPLVNDGNAVASWLLGWVQRRVSYAVTYRGNPALDLLDTVQIDDVYGVNGQAIITAHDFDFDGGLESDAVAIR